MTFPRCMAPADSWLPFSLLGGANIWQRKFSIHLIQVAKCMSVRLFYRWKGKTHYKEQCGRSFQKTGPHCSSAIRFPSHPWCRKNMKKAEAYLGGGDISPSTHMQIPVKLLGTNKGTWQKKTLPAGATHGNRTSTERLHNERNWGWVQTLLCGKRSMWDMKQPMLEIHFIQHPPKIRINWIQEKLTKWRWLSTPRMSFIGKHLSWRHNKEKKTCRV